LALDLSFHSALIKSPHFSAGLDNFLTTGLWLSRQAYCLPGLAIQAGIVFFFGFISYSQVLDKKAEVD
jgi:hypothetical protein